MISPSPSLFPDAAERKRIDDLLTVQLAEAAARLRIGPVKPLFDAKRSAAELAAFDFSSPRKIDECLAFAIRELEGGIVHKTHPRYFGLFNPAPTFPSECADRIVGAFNPQLAAATTSPAAVAIEAHVIAAVGKRAGLGEGVHGHFTSGGSEANFTALICALTRKEPRFAAEGARAFAGAPVFYVSADCHLAWIKIAHAAGIGRNAVRIVATDGRGEMDIAALRKAIADDRSSGNVPVMVVATAGTTNAGMIDPLEACAEVARAQNAWYHIDAAWGGGAIASDRLRPLLTGIEQADSVTIDAHKWFATTMGCGMFLTRQGGVLPEAFQVNNSFMPSQLPSRDPYMTSMQWSRRFLGLRLFLSLAAAGWPGFGEHVERAVKNAAALSGEMTSRGWTVANASHLAVVCLEPPPGSADVAIIADRVVRSGRAWVSSGRFEGRTVLRACITHGETSPEDVMALVRALEQYDGAAGRD